MNVVIRSTELSDYRQSFSVLVDDVEMMSCYDGEPEDNNLSRNFSGVYSIQEIIEKVYEAGCVGNLSSSTTSRNEKNEHARS